MNILYIDTHSTNQFSVGFFDFNIQSFNYITMQDAAYNMINAIEKISQNNFQKIIINKGPGSLTGLRIGSSFAQGLALSKQIEVQALSIWDILLNEFPEADIFFFTGTKKWIKKNRQEEKIFENEATSSAKQWISNKPDFFQSLNYNNNIPFPEIIKLMHKYKKFSTNNTELLYFNTIYKS